MKLIEPKAELLLQPKGLEGVYKQIELCGRTCYKSTDKITDESAKPFVERMIASKHTAMLEHGTVYLFYSVSCYDTEGQKLVSKYENNPYSKVICIGVDDNEPAEDGNNYYDLIGNEACGNEQYVITTNLRVLVENSWLEDLKYICEPTKYHEKRYTIKFTTDRGVSHELVRHRVFSFAQESTRYCNYSKDKFGKEITFIIPSWCPNYDETDWDELLHTLQKTEDGYFALLAKGCTPQQARQVLPNALKTEVCMTGFASDWRFFFDLRYYGETGKPHPDMELLASKARDEFIKAGIWDDIMSYPSRFDHE